MSLLAEFHARVRLAEPARRPGVVQDADGPVRRRYPEQPGTSYCLVECPEGLGEDAERWIARQVGFFADRGERFEWKLYSYDGPTDLPARLAAHGFTAGEPETVMLGAVSTLRHEVALPDGVRIRQVDSDEDLARVDTLMGILWPGHGDGMLRRDLRADPDSLDVVVVEESEDGPVLCAGWVRYPRSHGFASLWGGSTLPEWRSRGLYRTTVARRAALAEERGYRFVRVDCSDHSRPILETLGLEAVCGTWPFHRDPVTCG